MVRGTLKTKAAHAIPAHQPSYLSGQIQFSDIDVLKIGYYTSAEAVKQFIPEELEIEDEPLVTYTLYKWGSSSFGPYTEFIGYIEVTWNGEKYDYALDLILQNEGAIFSGREQYGLPKVFGKVVFDREDPECTLMGSLMAHVERPVGKTMMQFAFRPEERLQEVGSLPPPEKRCLALRIIPSSNIGQPPVIKEFVTLYAHFNRGELWKGNGSIRLTPGSDFETASRVPVVRYKDAFLITKATAAIDPVAKTTAL
jgi:acetoacetate decarboxylase